MLGFRRKVKELLIERSSNWNWHSFENVPLCGYQNGNTKNHINVNENKLGLFPLVELPKDSNCE